MHRLIISIPIQTAKIGGISIPNLQTPIYYYMVPESFMVVPSQHGLLVSWNLGQVKMVKQIAVAPADAQVGMVDGLADGRIPGWSWIENGQDGVPQDVSSVPQALKEGW